MQEFTIKLLLGKNSLEVPCYVFASAGRNVWEALIDIEHPSLDDIDPEVFRTLGDIWDTGPAIGETESGAVKTLKRELSEAFPQPV